MYSASICVGDIPAATSFLCCFAIKNSLTRVKFCDFSSARRRRVTLSTDSIVRLNVFLLYQRGCQAISKWRLYEKQNLVLFTFHFFGHCLGIPVSQFCSRRGFRPQAIRGTQGQRTRAGASGRTP